MCEFIAAYCVQLYRQFQSMWTPQNTFWALVHKIQDNAWVRGLQDNACLDQGRSIRHENSRAGLPACRSHATAHADGTPSWRPLCVLFTSFSSVMEFKEAYTGYHKRSLIQALARCCLVSAWLRCHVPSNYTVGPKCIKPGYYRPGHSILVNWNTQHLLFSSQLWHLVPSSVWLEMMFGKCAQKKNLLTWCPSSVSVFLNYICYHNRKMLADSLELFPNSCRHSLSAEIIEKTAHFSLQIHLTSLNCTRQVCSTGISFLWQ